MKKLRCLLTGHKMTRHRIEGETRVECRRCGRIVDSGDSWGRIYGGGGIG